MSAPAKPAPAAPAAPLRSADEMTARFLNKKQALEVDKLFRALVKLEGSDLHLKVGRPPFVRVKGTLRKLDRPPIDDAEMVRLCFPMMDERNRPLHAA